MLYSYTFTIRKLHIHFPRNQSRVPLDSTAVLNLIRLHEGDIVVVPDAGAPKRLRVADDPCHHCICAEMSNLEFLALWL